MIRVTVSIRPGLYVTVLEDEDGDVCSTADHVDVTRVRPGRAEDDGSTVRLEGNSVTCAVSLDIRPLTHVDVYGCRVEKGAGYPVFIAYRNTFGS